MNKAKHFTSILEEHNTKKEATPFAVFAVCPLARRSFAATTRAADKGEAGRIGLPGGKVDAGEGAIDALIRECAEEGWAVEVTGVEPIHTQLVDGKEVAWFLARAISPLENYKEKGRISPVVASVEDVVASGYGNDRVPLIMSTLRG